MTTDNENTDLRTLLEAKFAETNKNIASIQTTINIEIADIKTNVNDNKNRIDNIEVRLQSTCDSTQYDEIRLQLELLKQDRLRNNLRITGLPPPAFNNPDDTVMSIERVLQLGLIPSDYTAYVDRNKSSLIVSFASHSHKRLFTNALHQRRSLLVEEVFPTIQSNSNIYSNQLTPYFANIFRIAWTAKKDGKIHSASSMGGRIKVKLNETSQPTTIESEKHLHELINSSQNSGANNQHADGQLDSRDNNNNNNIDRNTSSTVINNSVQQPPQTVPVQNNQQQYTTIRPVNQFSQSGSNNSNINPFNSRLRSDINHQRLNSRDRAHGREFSFEDYQPPPSSSNNSSAATHHRFQRQTNFSRRGRYQRF